MSLERTKEKCIGRESKYLWDRLPRATEAGKDTVLYDLLARGIPALSYAAAVEEILAPAQGGSPVVNFNLERDGRPNGNIDWSTEGHADDDDVGRWLHSDFRNVALPYVFPVYEEMITQGSLDEN